MHATATRPGLQGPRLRTQLRRRGPLLDYADWYLVLIGVSCAFSTTLVGMLPYAEIFTTLALPYLLWKHGKILSRPGTRTVLYLMGLWLFSQMVSDVVNDTLMNNRLKGMARVISFAIDFSVFSILVGKNTKRVILLALALVVSELIRLPSYGPLSVGTQWKYGGSVIVSVLLMLFGSYLCVKRRYLLFAACVAILAFLNLRYAYRSQIAVDLVTLAMSLPFFSTRARSSAAARAFRTITLLTLSLGAVWLSQKILHEAVKRGYFEASIQEKFETQSSGKMGVLYGARPEIPVALRAIADAPLLGHGSYAIDPKYYALLQDYQYKYGYSESDEPQDVEGTGGIPTHSHLTASWVEGGFFASFLWFYLLWLIMRGIVTLSERRPVLTPFYAFLLITFFWDILFSPFGYDRRVFEAFFIVLLVNLTSVPAVASVSHRVRPYVKRIYRGVPNRAPFPGLPRPDTARVTRSEKA
jgi:hypothetical protein